MAPSPRAPLSRLLRAVSAIASGQRREAHREVVLAVAEAPGVGFVRVVASRLFFLLGDHQPAVDEARAAHELGTPRAAELRLTQLRKLGWSHEARAMLEGELPRGGAPWAMSPLLGMLFHAGEDDAAVALLDRYPEGWSSSTCYRAAQVYLRSGDQARARAAVDRVLALEAAPSARQTAALTLIELGAFAEAQAVHEALVRDDPASLPSLEALARLCLWRGEPEGALRYAERIAAAAPTSTIAGRVRAAVLVLHGEHREAMTLLDAVLSADPHDGEAYMWRGEAAMRLGLEPQAGRDLDRAQSYGYSFAVRALRLRLAVRPGDVLAPAIWQEVESELAALFPEAPAILAGNGGAGLGELLDRALVAIRGNRTSVGTWVDEAGALRILPPSESIRVLSRRALDCIQVDSPAETLAHLDALVARCPSSALPLVHRGELRLWLGDHAGARADLEGAIAVRRKTRWAWYGLACLDLLDGQPERALATCARGIAVMDGTEGPAALLYRGEAYRVLGRLDEARDQLQRSGADSPMRLSAWVNLALVHGAAGDRRAQRELVRKLVRSARSLVSDAARELGASEHARVVLDRLGDEVSAEADGETMDRLLERMLVMMRGNRASGCITYFTAEGKMRRVQVELTGDRDDDARDLGDLRGLLERALRVAQS